MRSEIIHFLQRNDRLKNTLRTLYRETFTATTSSFNIRIVEYEFG